MQFRQGHMGCSLYELFGMQSRNLTMSDGVFQPELIDVYTKDGVRKLIKGLSDLGKGGLVTWVDTSSNNILEYNGAKFYEFLKGLGYHVKKSAPYKNPGHSGDCTLYYWFFRESPKPKRRLGLASSSWRTTVEAKAKTTRRRVAT